MTKRKEYTYFVEIPFIGSLAHEVVSDTELSEKEVIAQALADCEFHPDHIIKLNMLEKVVEGNIYWWARK